MATRGIAEPAEFTLGTIRNILGDPFMIQMQRMTDNTIQQIDETVKSNFALASKFNVAMKRRFSKHVIIRLEPAETGSH
jgi:hypothetical protein